jgi:hypothetical protein
MIDKWISIENSLPEKDQRVLCVESYICNQKGDIEYNIQIATYSKYRRANKKYNFCDEQDEQPSILNPTHWMPLPEPPNQ